MNFVNGYDRGYMGAEGWGHKVSGSFVYDNAPFYAYVGDAIIIIDSSEGISLHEYNEKSEETTCWSTRTEIKTFEEAKKVVDFLESVNVETWVEYFKITAKKDFY